jgi:hemoglobin
MKSVLNKRNHLFMVMILFLMAPNLVSGQMKKEYKSVDEKSIYSRMGGYDVISNVIDDFLAKSWADPKISHFFVGMGTDTRNRLRQKNKNLMCATTGGPCRPINRPLEVVHEGLNITEKDFFIIVDHIMVSLEKFKVANKEREEIHAKLLSLKPKIVQTTKLP